MGFLTSATTVTLTAKLTPLGRQKLISTNNSLIATFSLGDSDANYYALSGLTTGQVPALTGDLSTTNDDSQSISNNVVLKNVLIVNENGITKKPVQTQSMKIISETILLGQSSISGSSITKNIIDRTVTSDTLVNLYNSFGLPLTEVNDNIFTATTYNSGGYLDTALSGLAQTKIVVLGIDNNSFGEIIDGKTIKITTPTSTATTYNIYSTYQSTIMSLPVQDTNLYDISGVAGKIENNIAFLFSDNIKKPNSDSTLSWGTGYGLNKPFSTSGKQLYNLQTNSNSNKTGDTIVGVAYLDKGIIVLTHPTVVNDFTTGTTTGTTISFNSAATNVYQNITCIADRGEFGSSTNSSFNFGDTPRISEIGLYDNLGNLIAVAKSDRHIIKNINEFLALSVKINL